MTLYVKEGRFPEHVEVCIFQFMERLKLYKRLGFVGVKISGDMGVCLCHTHRCAFGGSLEVEAFKDKRMAKIENRNEFQVLYLHQGKNRCH